MLFFGVIMLILFLSVAPPPLAAVLTLFSLVVAKRLKAV